MIANTCRIGRLAATVGSLVLASLAVTACRADGPAPVPGPGPGGTNGISVEEYERMSPPPPTDVRARVEGGTVVVGWTRPNPPAARGPLLYDPVVVGYRVFRLDADFTETAIGDTRGTSFVDRAPPRGRLVRYAVATLTRSGHQSGLSLEATVRVP